MVYKLLEMGTFFARIMTLINIRGLATAGPLWA